MLRLAELALFLAPFAAFLLWRFAGIEAGPSTRMVVGAACLLAVLAAVLVWLSEYQALPPGPYSPARMEDGQITSGHPKSR